MKLTKETTFGQFREEMQHRVVKYPLNSRPVKEALRFAKKHKDPAFYRVASDKIHAQRQFQRELHGPGRVERLVDFVSLGSLREVVITLLLVSAGVMSLEGGKRFLSPPDQELYEHMDIDELASALGVALDVSNTSNITTGMASGPADSSSDARQDYSAEFKVSQLAEEDVARIADAVMQRLVESGQWKAVETKTTPTSTSTEKDAAAEEAPAKAADSSENTTDQQVAIVSDNQP